MRKIVQISAVCDSAYGIFGIFALCNDGTLWLYDQPQGLWEKEISIPQSLKPEKDFVEQRDRIAEMLDGRES